jgi:hypothetical protein
MNLLIVFLFTAWGPAHAFHVSKAVVEYNPGEQAIQVSMHLFLDDLEAALKQTHPEPLYLCSDKGLEFPGQGAFRRLTRRMVLSGNSQNQSAEIHPGDPYGFDGSI